MASKTLEAILGVFTGLATLIGVSQSASADDFKQFCVKVESKEIISASAGPENIYTIDLPKTLDAIEAKDFTKGVLVFNSNVDNLIPVKHYPKDLQKLTLEKSGYKQIILTAIKNMHYEAIKINGDIKDSSGNPNGVKPVFEKGNLAILNVYTKDDNNYAFLLRTTGPGRVMANMFYVPKNDEGKHFFSFENRLFLLEGKKFSEVFEPKGEEEKAAFRKNIEKYDIKANLSCKGPSETERVNNVDVAAMKKAEEDLNKKEAEAKEALKNKTVVHINNVPDTINLGEALDIEYWVNMDAQCVINIEDLVNPKAPHIVRSDTVNLKNSTPFHYSKDDPVKLTAPCDYQAYINCNGKEEFSKRFKAVQPPAVAAAPMGQAPAPAPAPAAAAAAPEQPKITDTQPLHIILEADNSANGHHLNRISRKISEKEYCEKIQGISEGLKEQKKEYAQKYGCDDPAKQKVNAEQCTFNNNTFDKGISELSEKFGTECNKPAAVAAAPAPAPTPAPAAAPQAPAPTPEKPVFYFRHIHDQDKIYAGEEAKFSIAGTIDAKCEIGVMKLDKYIIDKKEQSIEKGKSAEFSATIPEPGKYQVMLICNGEPTPLDIVVENSRKPAAEPVALTEKPVELVEPAAPAVKTTPAPAPAPAESKLEIEFGLIDDKIYAGKKSKGGYWLTENADSCSAKIYEIINGKPPKLVKKYTTKKITNKMHIDVPIEIKKPGDYQAAVSCTDKTNKFSDKVVAFKVEKESKVAQAPEKQAAPAAQATPAPTTTAPVKHNLRETRSSILQACENWGKTPEEALRMFATYKPDDKDVYSMILRLFVAVESNGQCPVTSDAGNYQQCVFTGKDGRTQIAVVTNRAGSGKDFNDPKKVSAALPYSGPTHKDCIRIEATTDDVREQRVRAVTVCTSDTGLDDVIEASYKVNNVDKKTKAVETVKEGNLLKLGLRDKVQELEGYLVNAAKKLTNKLAGKIVAKPKAVEGQDDKKLLGTLLNSLPADKNKYTYTGNEFRVSLDPQKKGVRDYYEHEKEFTDLGKIYSWVASQTESGKNSYIIVNDDESNLEMYINNNSLSIILHDKKVKGDKKQKFKYATYYLTLREQGGKLAVTEAKVLAAEDKKISDESSAKVYELKKDDNARAVIYKALTGMALDAVEEQAKDLMDTIDSLTQQ